MATNEVSVDITVEEKAALKALARLSQGFDKTEKKATASINKMDGALAVFAGNIMTKVASQAIGFLVQSIGQTIDAAQRQEDAINSLNAALRQTGDFSEAVSQDLQDYASELQKITRFGDEAIIEQLAFAKSMGATTEQAKKIVAAATDMSAALNMDFNAAVRNITKTLGGLKGELGESISELGLLTKEQLQAGAAIDLISNKFAGQAQAATATYSGRVEQLSNSWGDLLENVGMFVTKNPAVLSAIDSVSKAVNSLNEIIGQDTAAEKAEKTLTRYDQLNAKIKETEKELANLRKDEDFFDFLKINPKIKELQMLKAQLGEVEKERLRISLEEEKRRLEAKSAGGGVVKDPRSDPRYIAEQQFQAEMKLLKEQNELAATEAELRKKEAQGLATEQDMEALRSVELMKIDIIAQSELEKAALIADANKRKQEIDKINAKHELDIVKKTSEQKIKMVNDETEKEKQLRAANFKTAKNFLSAGQMLVKQGTAEAKALAIGQATMNTYQGATAAIAPPPLGLGPVSGIPLMASTIALGLAQVAKISGAFANSGVIGGVSGASTGMDNSVATVRTGEMVLNANDQKEILTGLKSGAFSGDDAKMDRLINAISTQPVVVQVDGIEIARAVRDSREEGFAV